MNPLTNVKNITKLNETELSKGTTDKKSWHDMYKGSAWIFIGGLAYGLTEGDVLAVFSQYGEIVNINLVRDKKTGKTKGFCFLCYANQKSTVLAVDNLNSIKILNRTIRVDHVLNYKPPKDNEHDDDMTKQLKTEGCAPKPVKREGSPLISESSPRKKKSKKEKKKRKKDKKETDDATLLKKSKIKREKHDPGYDKYELPDQSKKQSSKPKKARIENSESSTSGESSDDESVVNSKRNDKEVYGEQSNKTLSRYVSNDIAKCNKEDSRKRYQNETDSDSSRNYVKKKQSKMFHSETKDLISSDGKYNKYKSKPHHDSSTDDDYRRGIEHKISQSKNEYSSGNKRKETTQRRSRSSSESVDDSDQYHRASERNYVKHSKSYDQDDANDGNDHRNSDVRSDRNYDGDHRTRDKSDWKNSEHGGDSRSRNYESRRVNLGESSHSSKHRNQNARDDSSDETESHRYNRDSYKYSKREHGHNSREKAEKHSTYRDDNRKDFYDKRKR